MLFTTALLKMEWGGCASLAPLPRSTNVLYSAKVVRFSLILTSQKFNHAIDLSITCLKRSI